MRFPGVCFLVLLGILFEPFFCLSQQLKDSYHKVERLIRMRDGVELFTSIYIPLDTTELHPFIIKRTPYSCSPYGENNYTDDVGNPGFIKEKYIIVFQDVRGRYMSGGTFTEMTPHKEIKVSNTDVDESSDTYDTVDWLLKNIKGNNGNVGLHGISYPGFYATASLPNAHPAIKAVSPQAPVTDEFEGDDVYHRGAFFLLDNVDFINWFDNPRKGPQQSYTPVNPGFQPKDAYEFYLKLGPVKNVNDSILHYKTSIWNEYVQHSTKDDYWKARNIRPHLKNIKPAVLVVGGWFDAEDMFGALKTYEAIENQNSKNHNFLLMGPWTHGGWSDPSFTHYSLYNFGMNTAEKFFETELKFFDYYLKGKGDGKQAEATIFFTGKNEWRSFDEWPVKASSSFVLYPSEKKSLSFTKPKNKVSFDEYISDPQSPVPYTDKKSGTRDDNYLGADQRFASKRSDVLSFSSPALKEDLALAGPLNATLYVSLSSTDADFVVKLVDVLPDTPNIQRMVRAEVIRGKFRNSFEKPEAFVPGKISLVKLTLNDIAHTFQKGHRIMVQIQSSWFPLTDMNPQVFTNIPAAQKADFKKSTIRLYHDKKHPSQIECRRLDQ